MIAGPVFHDSPIGRVCDCGARWVDALMARRSDVGMLGFAHTGALLEREYLEIEAERDRIWECGM